MLIPGLIALWALVAPANNVAGEPPLRLVLGRDDAQAHAAVLADGYTVVVVSPSPLLDGKALPLPAGIGAARTALPRGGFELTLGFPMPVRGAKVTRGNGVLAVEVLPDSGVNALRDRILAPLPRSVPSAFAAPRFRQAEVALTHLRLAEARVSYGELAREYALRPWSEVRLADVDTLEGEVGSACSRYRETATGYNDRTAGTVARLRLRALGCSGSADLPQLKSISDTVRRIEGPVGDYLRNEALWTLAREREASAVNATYEYLCAPVARRALATPAGVCDSLTARSLRLASTPQDVVIGYLRRQDAIASHPEASALRFAAGQAFTELGLPEQAIATLEQALKPGHEGALWRERQGPAQAALLLAEAYESVGRDAMSRQVCARHGVSLPPPPEPEGFASHPLGRTLTDLRQRIDSLRDRLLPLSSQMTRHSREESHEDGTL